MNKKGFSLTEILIVIAIIALVVAIAIPSITKSRKRVNERLYENKVEQIKAYAQMYAKNHKELFDSNESTRISVEKLLEVKYLEPDLKSGEGICDASKYPNGCIINPVDNSIINSTQIDVKKSKSKWDVEVSTLVDKILKLNPTRLTRTSFSSVLSTTNTGTLYTTTNTEDGSTVYYFAGNALNNWVKFGKCTSSSYNCTVGEDLYWRIIRTNTVLEDGGVRLLYAGSGSVSNQNAHIGSGAYNTSKNDPMYSGYMWGTTGSLANNRTNQTNKSTIATKVSAWYTATFNNNSDANSKDASRNLYDKYISKSAIYCNDRSVANGYTYNLGSTTFYYGARERLHADGQVSTISPTLACGATTEGYSHYFETTASIADKFTGSETNASGTIIGNGLLGNTPAALITADEIAFAGGKYGTNSPVWYYYNAAEKPTSITGTKFWWTMSPYDWSGANLYTNVFYVLGSTNLGWLYSNEVIYTGGSARPVISLKANVLWAKGDGSPSSPFEVSLT